MPVPIIRPFHATTDLPVDSEFLISVPVTMNGGFTTSYTTGSRTGVAHFFLQFERVTPPWFTSCHNFT